MDRIKNIAQRPQNKKALGDLIEQIPELTNLIIAVQQIPAPTFAEGARARFILKSFAEYGLQDVHADSLNNIYARLPGFESSSNPLVVSAHSDTVFPVQTDLTVKHEGDLLYGPGIGDNATGVGGILTLARIIKNDRLKHKSDIWLVANVGEEGMGNLRGMRAVVDRFGSKARYLVIEGGSFGQIIFRAIGVKRFRIAISTSGGHSWGSFGEPSAIHELGHIIAEISQIQVPTSPKTTFNIGLIEGGTTVNSIASSASLLLDLRSEEKIALERLVSQVDSIVKSRKIKANYRKLKISFHMEQVGYRPPGGIDPNDSLVCLADNALQYVGYPALSNNIGSTDANIPLSMGISCVCVGLTTSGNSHRLDEYIDLNHLKEGMQQLLLLVLAAANE